MQLSSKLAIKNGGPRGFPDHPWTLGPWGQPWRHLGRLFAIFGSFWESFPVPRPPFWGLGVYQNVSKIVSQNRWNFKWFFNGFREVKWDAVELQNRYKERDSPRVPRPSLDPVALGAALASSGSSFCYLQIISGGIQQPKYHQKGFEF